MSVRRQQPVFGADEPGSRRLPLAPRSRSVGPRIDREAQDADDGGSSPPTAVADAPRVQDATDAPVTTLPGMTREAPAAGGDDADGHSAQGRADSPTAPRAGRRLPLRLTLDVGNDEMPQLVRGGKANQVRSSALATRVLEDAVVALKQRGHGDASKQSVQEMLLLALRAVDAEALVGLHKQYRGLLQDAREAEAASQLG
jgi:hypothetical protein